MYLIWVALFFAYLFHELYWKRRKYPSGPMPLPFIGNLMTLAKYEPGYEAFDLWKKQYGPIYTIWLGSKPMVILTTYELMKNTYVKDGDSYIGKLQIKEGTMAFRDGDYGIVDTVGDQWREHRRFALQTFRDLGLGNNILQERILFEVEALTQELVENSKSRAEFSMIDIWDLHVACVINTILFGYRFEGKTIDEFRSLKKILSRAMKDFQDPLMLFSLMHPWTRHVSLGPLGKSKWDLLTQYKLKFFAFFEKQIQAHNVNFDEDSESRDYVEAYLKEKKKREDAGDYKSYCMLQLKNSLTDLWIAGLETSSNTLAWLVVYVLNHPHAQAKMQEEMDRVINSKRQITMSDKNQLPYVNAVINESQRLANLLPMNLMHETVRDVEINGYKLEKGTTVVAQISTVMYNEETFPDAYSFKPERFIDENGHLKKVDQLIPFSIGRRQCLGESLARAELFLFSANLFNRFTLSANEKPSMKKTFGTTMQPLPFHCSVQVRS